MNSPIMRRASRLLTTASLAMLLCACVVSDGGYGYGGTSVGVDYYAPYGGYYGGWGPGYQIAPYRNGGDRFRDNHRNFPARSHTYRSPPASHPMPSIPGRPHPGRFPKR